MLKYDILRAFTGVLIIGAKYYYGFSFWPLKLPNWVLCLDILISIIICIIYLILILKIKNKIIKIISLVVGSPFLWYNIVLTIIEIQFLLFGGLNMK